LLPEDTVGQQVYVHDLETGTLELISLDFNGNPIADGTQNPNARDPMNRRYISDDGRYALFATFSPNVVPGFTPTNIFDVHVYRRDRQTQTTTLITVDNNDVPADRGVTGWMMDPTGVAALFVTQATNLDPDALSGDTWYLHRADAPIGSSERTRAACRDRNGVPRRCLTPAISCGGALITARLTGPSPWIEGEDLPFGSNYNEVAIGNTIAGNWIRVGNEADTPFPPGASESFGGREPSINCSGDRIAFWTNLPIRNGDTNDGDLYVFNVISRQMWLIEESPGVSLASPQGTQGVSIDASGLQIAFTTDKALDPADDNTFNDVYAFEMPPNPSSLNFDFQWVSNNDGVAPISLFTAQPTAGGNGVVGFRTGASNAPWPVNGAGGTFGQLYARSNLPREYIYVDGFE